MLGDAMARAAGWTETPMPTTTPKPLATITVNKYATPTASNKGCDYSVGVMNLTRDEADKLSACAEQLQRDRYMTATAQRERDLAKRRDNPSITSAEVRPFTWGRNKTQAEVYGSPAYVERTKQLRDEAFDALIDDEVNKQALYKAEMEMTEKEKRTYLEGDWLAKEIGDDDRDDAMRDALIAERKYAAARRRNVFDVPVEPAKPKEPEPVRNRFSGLDLG